ncbi:hypothetical protein [Bacteriovorax sp. Seq25_V]|uniref:hypothetical protein n=1 Tax=Bacteriovorax sp. Seq25_V TaxID=1201288 RepID=UPI00038A3079|nr:hypothetical protein [Bacteriovorax sp. Seq25_V]EQC43529.1 hypothetical protein M900_0148 [Bacteriovorax sp. Seq25_V]
MSSLEELKKQMNQIIEDNKPSVVLNSKEDRRIREFETELIESGIKVEFSITVAELNPELAEHSFGGSGFKRDQYSISWKKWEGENFRLVLTNIPHNNGKLLLKTPEQFKKDAVELLDEFATKFSESFN